MSEEFSEYQEVKVAERSKWKKYATHGLLFLVTFITTTLAGVQWLNNDPFELENFTSGLSYSLLLLLMLSAHEFGHYFAARYHRVETTLPYFIPLPPFPEYVPFVVPFGTLGAVIRIRSLIPSRKILFDIGAAGPIAGFIVSLLILIVGFATLPPREYLYTIHPEYAGLSNIPVGGVHFGETILFGFLASVFTPENAFIPPMNEVYHYPLLCVGWFGLFVTALNLIPIGQLDGGHISYSMFGKGYHTVAQIALTIMIVIGLAGLLPAIGIDFKYGFFPWLFWAFVLIFIMRNRMLNRPALPDESELDPMRRALGWFCYGILITSFSIVPFDFGPM